jgi:hypothetical protein
MSDGPVINLPRSITAQVEAAIEDRAVADTFRPEDDLLKQIAQYANTYWGAKVFSWLHDLTDRAPYPMATGDIQELAMAASRHQGRAGVGHVLAKAVHEGNRLLNNQGTQP